MKKALVIIDIQNDYFPTGRMELFQADEASQNAMLLLEQARKEGTLVVHIQHIALQEGATFFLPNTQGAEIHENVKPLSTEKLITKHYPNGFRETELLAYLKSQGISDLVFAGMMTHVCIDATVKAAKDFGFNCTVIGDACATRDLEVNGESVKATEVQKALLGALNFFYAEIQNTQGYLNHKASA